ncbi:SAM-dependent methyltransferase [Nocardia sp. NBC_01503]|uniref:SAM-dependent methyltransferase n=1 Tax=Nocardia sp. NBC_01503 TaxID=2975997 RepID=UPI002E7B0F5B|nr:SAM-dependent methyltransferase [Nocardia sp. NBC_01503]WTL29274.1 SAM-dependent methyltransferase [Nocardia sp. NBC_01503]
MNSESAAERIDTSKPHPARRYDYWLGGKDNFPADRESADAVAEAFPTVRLAAVENRNFLRRVTRYLAAEAGIRQFLDIGAGLPTAGNVHEIAQGIAPESRIVYIDNDPIVLVHARTLLNSAPEGRTAYIDADLRDPDRILDHPDLRATLDLNQPVALMLVAIMHFFTDDTKPYELVRTLCEALPPGSHLVMSHATNDYLEDEDRARTTEANQRSGVPFQLRSSAEFTKFFSGFELVAPGITSVTDWRPDEYRPQPRAEAISMLGGVAHIR